MEKDELVWRNMAKRRVREERRERIREKREGVRRRRRWWNTRKWGEEEGIKGKKGEKGEIVMEGTESRGEG